MQQQHAVSAQPIARYIGTLKDALRAARDELIKHDAEYHHLTDPAVKRLIFDAILSEPARSSAVSKPRCSRCGFERKEHTYNGACYGVCGEFVERTEPQTAPDRNDAAWALLSRWENIAKNGGEKWLREHPLVEETTKILNQEDCSNLPQTAGSEAAVELIEAQAESADTADLTQQEVTTVINWAKEHDLPIPAALFAHFKMSRRNQPQAETTEGAAVADQIIGQIEERFPNWRSYRDLIDCIDCTLHQLRSDAVARTLSLTRP